MNKEKMELGKKMDAAVHYAAKNLRETGHNSKPVLSHSFRVADLLYQLDYNENVVIAAVLHDLIEDTDVVYEDIVGEYGKTIADIVAAVSFDPQIEDYLEQAKKMFEACVEYGIDAIVVKCSDLIQNIDFVQFVENLDKRRQLLSKYELFLDMTSNIIGETKLYQILQEKYEKYKELGNE